MLFYRAALPLSCKTLNYAAGIIRRHRKSIGSRWRKLNPGRQALLVLAHLRKGETFAELAAGFAVGTTTAWRYIEEVVALLAARAPKLRQAVRDAKKAGHAYVVLDGTLIPVDRVAADRPFYSGKHKKHGMNLQVIASPGGGAAHAKIPYRGKNKPESQKEANRAHAKLRAPGERANAQLKTWRILRKLRCCPWRAGQLAKAIHVLQVREAYQDGKGSFRRLRRSAGRLRLRWFRGMLLGVGGSRCA
jgi:DDE superfamily endonuclease